MAVTKWEAPAAIATHLSTELNSLGNGSRSAASAEIDNAANKHRWAMFELAATFAATPTNRAFCTLYILPSLDGTNFADGSDTVEPSEVIIADRYQVRNVASAQRMLGGLVRLPPFKFKLLIKNEAGTAMAASGNTLKMRTFNEETI